MALLLPPLAGRRSSGARRSTSRARASAARRTSGNVQRRSIRTLTWMPREPDVFGQPTRPDRLERLAGDQRHLADLRPADARDRVEVDPQLVGVVEVVGADRVRVEVDAAEVHDPGEPGRVVDHDLVGRPPRRERQLDGPIQAGRLSGRPLLEEELPRGAVDEALERHRPAAGAAQRAVRDGEVVADEVELGVAGLREVDLVRVGDRDLAAADPEDLLRVGMPERYRGRLRAPRVDTAPARVSIWRAPFVVMVTAARRAAATARRHRDALPAPDLHRRGARPRPLPGEASAEIEAYNAFGEWLRERGMFLGRRGAPADVDRDHGPRPRRPDDATDGPFAETKEALGGYYLIEAADLDEAIEAAARIPGARARARSRSARSASSSPADADRRAPLPSAADAASRRRPPVPRGIGPGGRDAHPRPRRLRPRRGGGPGRVRRRPRALAARGVPDNPGAWITTTARNRAIDRLRRARRWSRRRRRSGARPRSRPSWPPSNRTAEDEMSPIADDRLRLIFTCCHPALALEAQVALTLRTLGGLTTPEIARAFLVPEATLAQRLVRAKRKIRDAGIPYRVPPDHLLPERLDAVLRVLYLDLQRGLRGVDRRGADPARAVRRGDPARPRPRRAHARRAGGARPARADAPPRCPPRGAGRAGGRARAPRGPGSRALGPAPDRRRAGARRAGAADAAAGPYQVQAAIAAVHDEAPRRRRRPTGPRSRRCTTRSTRSRRRRSSSSTGPSPSRWPAVRPPGSR